MYRFILILIFSSTVWGEILNPSLQMTRSEVGILWSNVTDGKALCQGTQCHVINIQCSISAESVTNEPTFNFDYTWQVTIARANKPVSGPRCINQYLHQCTKSGTCLIIKTLILLIVKMEVFAQF